MQEEHDSIDAVMDRMDALLDIFDGIARHAHKTYRSYKEEHLWEHSKRSQANCIYDHMAEEAKRRFDGQANIRLIEIRGLKLWLIDDHTAVRLKKMDEDGKSRNYPTKQAKAFDFNRQLDGLPAVPTRITIGYVLDKFATTLIRTQVARPNGYGVDWCAAIIPESARAQGAKKWEDVSKQQRIA